LRTDLDLDALEQAVYGRCHDDTGDLVHHSDRGTPYLSIRYTERLADADIELSVGSRGDAYDNALAESVIGLFKTEVIRRRGPWRSVEAVEFATLDWVDWFNHRRLLEPIGHVPPAEYDPGVGFRIHHTDLLTDHTWLFPLNRFDELHQAVHPRTGHSLVAVGVGQKECPPHHHHVGMRAGRIDAFEHRFDMRRRKGSISLCHHRQVGGTWRQRRRGRTVASSTVTVADGARLLERFLSLRRRGRQRL
jgi:hypothetical protein